MGRVFRIDLTGQRGLRSYVREGSVSEAFLRGLAHRRRMEVEKGNVRCMRESTINCPSFGKHDHDPAA